MLIAQISDTHVPPPRRKACGVAAMDENLRRCVHSINTLQPRPDVVLLTGDVTNDASQAETNQAKEILSILEVPLLVVPGNHDDSSRLAETFGSGSCPVGDNGLAHFVVEGYPLRLIGLNSTDPGKPGGRLDPESLDWLDRRLAEEPDRPTVIFTHHPPLKLGVPETDEDGFIGAERLGDIVAGYSNIERILCGHIHLHTNTRWQGTIVTTAPSPGMQLTLDLTQRDASRFLLSDPAYLLHHWTADRVLITHLIQLSALEGPFDF